MNQSGQLPSAGTYRFVVHGQMRQGGHNVDYQRTSNAFRVMPWAGITVNNLKLDPGGHVTFAAGPGHQIAEQTVRRTARPAFNADGSANPKNDPVTFSDPSRRKRDR